MKTKRTSFGKRLNEIRTKKGLSLRELAKLTNISYRMIAHYETKASTIPIDKITLISKALDTSLDELAGTQEIEKIKPLKEKPSRLLNKLKTVEDFSKKEQKQVVDLIQLIKNQK